MVEAEARGSEGVLHARWHLGVGGPGHQAVLRKYGLAGARLEASTRQIETQPHRDVCRGQEDDDPQEKCDTDLLEQAKQRVQWTNRGDEQPAKRGSGSNEVVVGLSPGFGLFEGRTITKECDDDTGRG